MATVLAYSGSYFARGVLAGRGRAGLYGELVATEALVRLTFALAVAVVIERVQGGTGGELAAPIAAEVLKSLGEN